MLPEISRSTQPKFSEFETDNQSPKFRSNDCGIASIQVSRVDRTLNLLVWALLLSEDKNQRLEYDLARLGDAYTSEEIRPIQLEAVRDELRRKDDQISFLHNRLAEAGIDVVIFK